jgi:phenylacetate-CoA ligase
VNPSERRRGYWDAGKETLSASDRRQYQRRWLAGLLGHAEEHAPGVRRRLRAAGLTAADLGDEERLARLPVIKKSEMPDLQKADPPFGGFCTVPRERVRKIFLSPGPIVEPMGPEAGGWHLETGLYAGGFRRGDVVLNTFSYQFVPAAHEMDEALNAVGCTVVPAGVGNSEQQVAAARAVVATGYVGTPSFLMTLLKKADESGAGRLPLEVAQVGAEPLPESLRKVFQDDYGIMTRQGFGTADLGMIAYECAEGSGMHLLEDTIVQICDPTSGAPLAAGLIGEIVATVNNPIYPMIRFATGDLSVVTEERCPCGRTSPRMLGWRGRADEVTKVRGMFVHPRQADEIVARVGGVARFQVVVGRDGHQDTLTFRVELAGGADPAVVTPAMEAAIRDVMKLRGGVEIVAAGTVAEGAKKISDERQWD